MVTGVFLDRWAGKRPNCGLSATGWWAEEPSRARDEWMEHFGQGVSVGVGEAESSGAATGQQATASSAMSAAGDGGQDSV